MLVKSYPEFDRKRCAEYLRRVRLSVAMLEAQLAEARRSPAGCGSVNYEVGKRSDEVQMLCKHLADSVEAVRQVAVANAYPPAEFVPVPIEARKEPRRRTK